MRSFLLALALLGAGCNDIAGIAGFHTVDGGVGGSNGGAGGNTGNGGTTSSGGGTSTGGALPSCSNPDVALRVTVLDAQSPMFTGIHDQFGLFDLLEIGHTFQSCVPAGTALDLRAMPGDPNGYTHDWGVCGSGRRCTMTVESTTVIDVHLQ